MNLKYKIYIIQKFMNMEINKTNELQHRTNIDQQKTDQTYTL
jgi:hypothetical protein